MQLTMIPIGNSTGVILPKEVLAALHLKRGDKVSLVRTRDGFEIVPRDEKFDEELKVVEKYANKYRNALRKLAE